MVQIINAATIVDVVLGTGALHSVAPFLERDLQRGQGRRRKNATTRLTLQRYQATRKKVV